MITIFKDKNDIPQNMAYEELNDLFFNQNTAQVLDERVEKIIEEIDGSKMTVLNVIYYPDRVCCLKEF